MKSPGQWNVLCFSALLIETLSIFQKFSFPWVERKVKKKNYFQLIFSSHGPTGDQNFEIFYGSIFYNLSFLSTLPPSLVTVVYFNLGALVG